MPAPLRVLVTGANGQVGRELLRADWPAGAAIVGLTSSDLDITDQAALNHAVEMHSPTVIVNAAAYTAVDKAEDDEDRANAVNGTAVGYLAAAAQSSGALLIHISTDYVFDGSKPEPYLETDPVVPIGAYGRSKALGEIAAAAADGSVTLRTAWVYGALGSNFVTTMLRLAADRDELGVVADQFGCPTAAIDIAATIVEIVAARLNDPAAFPHSLYHVASPDDANWHEFAMAIFEASDAGFAGVCKQLTTAEYPTKAVRPANSRLSTDRLAKELGHHLPSWRDRLPSVVAECEGATRGQ